MRHQAKPLKHAASGFGAEKTILVAGLMISGGKGQESPVSPGFWITVCPVYWVSYHA
jgi:hypothetical protein